MIRINVDGVTATVTEKEILTAGRVGLECAFTFTGEWDGLFKTAVFQGVESVDVALPDNTCVVPWEAMQVEGVQLKIGVFGANGAGTIVIPTIWANAGKIQPSAAGSGTEPTEPSQNANAYAVETAEEAKNIALSVQQRANDGEFDGADGAAGADGFSPSASVSKAGNTATITITDENGTTTASINDGADGVDGSTLWTTTVEPAEPIGGGYEFMVSDLTGVSGGTPAAGDIIFYGSAYYPITSVTGHSVLDRKAIADTRTSIRGATGPAATDEQVQTAVDAWLEEHPEEIGEQVQDAVDEYLGNHPTVTGTFTNAAKRALIALLEKVAYTIEDGQDYLDALENELSVPVVDSISAVFSQGSAVIYDTDSLDTLKQYLVVTATYFDSSTEVLADSVYTLSGTLSKGTSTITVSYGGKTTTFNVTVSIGLDSIAYGNLTYRDIFITNNLVAWYGNFENDFVISPDYTYKESGTQHYNGYKVATASQANPSVSIEQFNSPNHSLDVSASGSSCYMSGFYQSTSSSDFGVDYLLAYAAKLSNYGGGKVEMQIYGNSSSVIRCIVSANTDGWQPVVAIGAPEKGSNDFLNINFGALGNTTLGNPNFTAFIDDLVVVRKPSGMTLAQAQTLYADYLEIARRAS